MSKLDVLAITVLALIFVIIYSLSNQPEREVEAKIAEEAVEVICK